MSLLIHNNALIGKKKALDYFYFTYLFTTGMVKDGSELISEMYSKDEIRLYQGTIGNRPVFETPYIKFVNGGSSATSDFFYTDGFNADTGDWDKFYFGTGNFFIGTWFKSIASVSGNDVQGVINHEQSGTLAIFADLVESTNKIRGGITNTTGTLIYLQSVNAIARNTEVHLGFGRTNGKYYLTLNGVIEALNDRGSNDAHKRITGATYHPVLGAMSGVNRRLNGYLYDMLITKNSHDLTGKVVGDTLFTPWTKGEFGGTL